MFFIYQVSKLHDKFSRMLIQSSKLVLKQNKMLQYSYLLVAWPSLYSNLHLGEIARSTFRNSNRLAHKKRTNQMTSTVNLGWRVLRPEKEHGNFRDTLKILRVQYRMKGIRANNIFIDPMTSTLKEKNRK